MLVKGKKERGEGGGRREGGGKGGHGRKRNRCACKGRDEVKMIKRWRTRRKNNPQGPIMGVSVSKE